MIDPALLGAPRKTVLTKQIRTVESVDISEERSRFYFKTDGLTLIRDTITVPGMSYAAMPGARVRVTIELVEGEESP